MPSRSRFLRRASQSHRGLTYEALALQGHAPSAGVAQLRMRRRPDGAEAADLLRHQLDAQGDGIGQLRRPIARPAWLDRALAPAAA